MTGTQRSATDVMIDELLWSDRRMEIALREADRHERLARAAAHFKKA